MMYIDKTYFLRYILYLYTQKLQITIIIEITTLIINKSKLLTLTNIQNIVIAPIADPVKIFFKLVCLLKITPTLNSNNKSKPKFSNNTISIYIFILSPNLL